MNRPTIPSSDAASDSSASQATTDSDFLRNTAYIPADVTDEPVSGARAEPEPGPGEGIPIELVHQALDASFRSIFHVVATRRGAHWELQQFETQALVQGWGPIAQLLLMRLGSSEQVLITIALASTAAVVGGKIAQEATKRASSTASTKTQKSGVSSASSASGEAERPPAQSNSFEEGDE